MSEATNYPLIEAQQLEPGQLFKTNNQKKFRICQNTILLPNRVGIPKEHQGQILISFNNCRQWRVDPEFKFQTTHLSSTQKN